MTADTNTPLASRGPLALPRVVVVGAGFGGIEVARHLRNAPVRVTVIDRHNYHLFQPLLYQVATADLSPADITAPIRSILRRQANAEVVLGNVVGVDVAAKRVRLREYDTAPEQTIPYDYLVIATGAGQSYFGHDEWAPYAPGLKSVFGATQIRRQILLAFEQAELEPDPDRQRALLTFVVVGGGPTGVELAGAIAELTHRTIIGDFRHVNAASARVLLVEALDRILPPFPESLARKAADKLARLGVEVHVNSKVEDVTRDCVVIAGQQLPASTIIWAAGVKASSAAQWLDAQADRSGRVIVQDNLTLRDHPEIYVIGDTANVEIRGNALPGLAPVAMQEGRYVATSIKQKLSGIPTLAFSYTSKGNLATVGRGYALADFGFVRFSGFVAWILWVFTHIFYLIGFRNRVIVLLQWAWAYLTAQRGARLIVPDLAEREELSRVQHATAHPPLARTASSQSTTVGTAGQNDVSLPSNGASPAAHDSARNGQQPEQQPGAEAPARG